MRVGGGYPLVLGICFVGTQTLSGLEIVASWFGQAYCSRLGSFSIGYLASCGVFVIVVVVVDRRLRGICDTRQLLAFLSCALLSSFAYPEELLFFLSRLVLSCSKRSRSDAGKQYTLRLIDVHFPIYIHCYTVLCYLRAVQHHVMEVPGDLR
jgi:hypothetical protein